jgi:uncharacterized membrane protein
MPDPVEPTPPTPPPVPEPDASAKSNSTGLPSNVAAALACFPLIGGIIFYILEKDDRFVRFYAMQSIIFGGVWILFGIVSQIMFAILGATPAIGGFLAFLWGLVALFVQLAFLVILIITIVKAFTNVHWDIPYIGPIARKQIGEA